MYPFKTHGRSKQDVDYYLSRVEGTNFLFQPTPSPIQNKDNKYEENMQKTISYLKSTKVISSYNAYFDLVENLLRKRISTQFYLFYDGTNIYTFYSYSLDGNVKFLCKYRDSNKKVFEYAKKVFGFSDSKTFLHFESTPMNNFSFFSSLKILRIIFTKEDILSRNEEVFTTFKKKSKNGKIRDIVAPHDDIKETLRDLNSLLQKVYDGRNANFQIAYKKNKNVKSGALLHVNHKYVYNIDLHDFYPSCKKELVKKYTDFLFSYSCNRKFIEEEFFSVILMNDGLFIGSPISGTLANVIISGPVSYMKNICKKFDIELSVYADDISFSSDKFIVKDFILKIFDEAFTKYKLNEYFTLNEKKCKGFSGMHRKITGVSINGDDKITVSRRYYRELRTAIDHLGKGDPSVNIQKLRGQIAYATMIDESGKIYKYLMKQKAIIDQFNLCSDEKIQNLPR